jgi:hypothetical protein
VSSLLNNWSAQFDTVLLLMLETMMLPFVMSYLIIGRQPRKRRAINVKPGKAV